MVPMWVLARSPNTLNVFQVFSDFVTFCYSKRRAALERTVSLNEQDMAKVNSKPPQNLVAA
jgi:hypothetical protein